MTRWQSLAACHGLTSLFYVERGESTEPAKGVCKHCAVRAECLEHALEHGERLGVWGGMSERERHRLRAARRQGAA